jgi:hypothetical protein
MFVLLGKLTVPNGQKGYVAEVERFQVCHALGVLLSLDQC